MHDGSLVLIAGEVNSQAPDNVKVALIGLIGVVLVSLIGAWSATRRFRTDPDDEPRGTMRRRLTNAILQQRMAERDAAIAMNEAHDLRRRISVLERFLWRRRFDPKLIITGEEGPPDVRIRT